MKILFSLLMAVMFLGGQAVADGSDICDGQVGAAYGLCQAYCIAMECAGPDPAGTEEACSQVSDRFEQVTGFLPPCCGICPLWTRQELEDTYNRWCCGFMADDSPEGSCSDGYIAFLDGCINDDDVHDTFTLVAVAALFFDDGDCDPDGYEGKYIEVVHPDTVIHSIIMELSESQYHTCMQMITTFSFTQCDPAITSPILPDNHRGVTTLYGGYR